MSITTQYGVGVVASEAHCLIRPRKNWVGKRAVVYCHGANRTAKDGVGGSGVGYADIPRYLGEDLPVIYADLGGLYTWGNGTARGKLDAVRTWMTSVGALTDQIILVGASMGAALACNWARVNPTLVKALALFIPAVDVEDIRANNRSGLQAGIETAWTDNTAWQAARATNNPVEYAASLSAIPSRVWYSTDDPICLPAKAQAFAAAAGSTLTSLGAVGHDVTGLDITDIRNWINERA